MKKVYRVMVSRLAVVLLLLSFSVGSVFGQLIFQADKREMIAMRLIGHNLLSCSGDESTRVRPITVNDNGGYVISFESELSIDPTDLEEIVAGVMTDHSIAENYWVEVFRCADQQIMHTYQVGPKLGDMLPCQGRSLKSGCYEIAVTLHDNALLNQAALLATQAPTPREAGGRWWLLVAAIALPLGLWLLAKRRGGEAHTAGEHNVDMVSIGASKLDTKNLLMMYQEESVELSHKEAALLTMLHRYANKPVERQELLTSVWGDQGDYVGRTLDVFISRLRKKLQSDTTLKIVNIRGVGYKLIVD